MPIAVIIPLILVLVGLPVFAGIVLIVACVGVAVETVQAVIKLVAWVRKV